jgi:hypothetical protein
MEANQAQIAGLQVQVESKTRSPRVTHVNGDGVSTVNLMPTCVDIFFEDGSRLFITNATRFTDGLKFEVK